MFCAIFAANPYVGYVLDSTRALLVRCFWESGDVDIWVQRHSFVGVPLGFFPWCVPAFGVFPVEWCSCPFWCRNPLWDLIMFSLDIHHRPFLFFVNIRTSPWCLFIVRRNPTGFYVWMLSKTCCFHRNSSFSVPCRKYRSRPFSAIDLVAIATLVVSIVIETCLVE